MADNNKKITTGATALTDADNYIGKIYTGAGAGLRGFVRGAGGIYGLDLSHAPSEQSATIGFRCAK